MPRKHESAAKLLRYKLESEQSDIDTFKASLDTEECIGHLLWGPTMDAAMQTAANVNVYTRYLRILDHTPDGGMRAIDDDNPEELVARALKSAVRAVLHGARFPSHSTSPSSNLARQYELAAEADMIELLQGEI